MSQNLPPSGAPEQDPGASNPYYQQAQGPDLDAGRPSSSSAARWSSS